MEISDANKEKIDQFEKAHSTLGEDPDVQYAQLIASLDLNGLSVDEVDQLYAECRKARSRRTVKELGY